MRGYVEFATASNFSFLRGASHPQELIAQAAHLGHAGFGLCDRNSVAGLVRAYSMKRENNLPIAYHPGARLVFVDGTPDILAYPRDRLAWGRLCRLLTVGNLRAPKGDCFLFVEDLLEHIEGLELIVMAQSSSGTRALPYPVLPEPAADKPLDLLRRLRTASSSHVRLAAAMLYRGDDRARLVRMAALAQEARVPLIAVNDVLYHHPERRPLQDVLTCIREHTTIDKAGRLLDANAERHLKPPAEMARLFRDVPEAIEETLRLSSALSFSLDQLRYAYPDEDLAGFASAQEALAHLTWQGAAKRYPGGIPDSIRATLDHELALIARVKYAPYFLTVHKIVQFARSKEILCQGRGSAANSAVCFCLGITEVDPVHGNLLFERFISEDRGEPPDIDVDFEHERREEVIQHIYEHYGRERAGIAATVISYRGRSALRDVGKVFGLSADTIGALASSLWGMGGGHLRDTDVSRVGLSLDSSRVQMVLSRVKEIMEFPRHLSQHVGGFVITRDRLDESVPIMNGAMDDRTHIEWDKDDIDALMMMKVDVLGLGMLSCIRKALDMLAKHYEVGKDISPEQELGPPPRLDLSEIPAEDSAVYDMLCRADSLGVFQVESRAQMSMLPRLRPRKFYDLVIEVAIVRPGPIQGDMVHPYLRRRQGVEKVEYPKDELKAVLDKTLGVPLFQEQAMRIAIVAAGFTPGEADRLRRAMATFKRVGTIGTFQRKMIDGMVKNGYEAAFAERCFRQIEGFGEYGFPESHAASFALLVYVSSWLKCHYPDVFAAALLNSQPMGFYASAQIIRDVRDHGVEVRPVDIQHSEWDNTLEPGPHAGARVHPLHQEMAGVIKTTHAVRLGMREIKGMKQDDARLIVAMRRSGYDSIRDVWLRTGLDPGVLELLADADAFGSLGLTRREALWAVKALGRVGDQDDDLPLFQNGGAISSASVGSRVAPFRSYSAEQEAEVHLPPMPIGEEVVNDYRFLRLSLRAHPAQFLRGDLAAKRILTNDTLRSRKSGSRVSISGLVTCRQRPGSAKGVVFLTIEDETSVANIVVWPAMMERFRPVVLGARYIAITGKMQQEAGVIHVVAERLEDLTYLLARLADGPAIETRSRGDEVHRPQSDRRGKDVPTGQHRRLSALLAEMPELAADLDVHARGTAHAPTRRGR
jgi:error-prone DNA polymerase